MEDRKTSVRVTIGGQLYQINMMNPRRACWLFGFITSKAPAEGKWGDVLRIALGQCTEEEFLNVQQYALECVHRIHEEDGSAIEFPSATIMQAGEYKGKIVDEVLKAPNALYEATIASISTNLAPFLTAGESYKAEPTAPAAA